MKRNLREFNLSDYAPKGMAGKAQEGSSASDNVRHDVAGEWTTKEYDPMVASHEDRYEDACEVVRQLVERHKDITPIYDDYIHAGMALKTEFGERGRTLYHSMCKMYPRYSESETDKKFDSYNGQGINIGTFFYLAKRDGIDISEIARERVRRNAERFNWLKGSLDQNGKNNQNNTIFGNNNPLGSSEPMNQVNQTDLPVSAQYTFSDKIKKENLPKFLQQFYDVYPNAKILDMVFLAVSAVSSAVISFANGGENCKGGVYGRYGKRIVHCLLYAIGIGSSGSSKGDLAICKDLAKYVKKEVHEKSEAAYRAWKLAFAQWEAAKKKKGNEATPAPVEPEYAEMEIPCDSSASAFVRGLHANQGGGFMFDTEADTMVTAMEKEYGNYSVYLRKNFQGEPISMKRTTDNLHIEIEHTHVSLILTCTEGQVTRLLPAKDIENGLASRFIFYRMNEEEKVEFMDVFDEGPFPLEDFYDEKARQLLDLYHALLQRRNNPLQFTIPKAMQNRLRENFEAILKENYALLGPGFKPFVYRMALTMFRIAMLLSLLRSLSDRNENGFIIDPDANTLECNETDFETAMTITECLLRHSAHVYTVLKKDFDNPFDMHGLKLSTVEMKVYNDLPDTDFQAKDYMAIAMKHGLSQSTAKRVLNRFVNKYRILTYVKRGVYCKPKPADTPADNLDIDDFLQS